MDNKLNMISPWEEFYRMIEAFFGRDPEIRIEIDRDEYKVKLYVDDGRKADALEQILPEKKTFGNIEVSVIVIPANEEKSVARLFTEAFDGNPVLYDSVECVTPFGDIEFVVFEREVVQYHNDDLFEIDGKKSTLYQDIAKEVFADIPKNVHFCTR